MSILLLSLAFFGFVAILPFSALILAITGAIYFLREKRPSQDPYCSHTFTVMVPAHDEQASIEATVTNLLALDYPTDRFEVLVIADNCSDETARIARDAGATVLERFHDTKKSKGYALEYALEHLRAYQVDGPGSDGQADPKHAYVVIDADSIADAALLRRLNDYHCAGYDWLQAYYTASNPEESDYTKMLTYAFALFNGCWQLGLSLLGLGACFRGNGMSFTKAGLMRHPFNVYGLTEDLEFSWRLRIEGEKIAFLPHVKVYGEMVKEQDDAAQSQRVRWEQGRAALKKAYGPKVWSSTDLSVIDKIAYLADLYMLPLTKYLAVLLGLTIAVFAVNLTTGSGGRLLTYGIILLTIFGCYSVSPLFRLNLPIGYLAVVYKVPKYVLWKLILFFKKDQKAWVRTKRNSEN